VASPMLSSVNRMAVKYFYIKYFVLAYSALCCKIVMLTLNYSLRISFHPVLQYSCIYVH